VILDLNHSTKKESIIVDQTWFKHGLCLKRNHVHVTQAAYLEIVVNYHNQAPCMN